MQYLCVVGVCVFFKETAASQVYTGLVVGRRRSGKRARFGGGGQPPRAAGTGVEPYQPHPGAATFYGGGARHAQLRARRRCGSSRRRSRCRSRRRSPRTRSSEVPFYLPRPRLALASGQSLFCLGGTMRAHNLLVGTRSVEAATRKSRTTVAGKEDPWRRRRMWGRRMRKSVNA